MVEVEERVVYRAIPWTEVGTSVKEVAVAVDTVALGENSCVAISDLNRSGETRDYHTSVRLVGVVVGEEADSRSRTRMLSEVDSRNLTVADC